MKVLRCFTSFCVGRSWRQHLETLTEPTVEEADGGDVFLLRFVLLLRSSFGPHDWPRWALAS